MHSGEYYYDKQHHQWFDIDNRPRPWEPPCPLEKYTLEPELVKSLRLARKTGKFLMVSNNKGQRYRGIAADYIYLDTASLKFLLYSKNKYGNIRRSAYWYTETNYGNKTHYIDFECVVNKNKVLKLFNPDYSQVVDYVEDVSIYGCHSKEDEMKFRKAHFDMLDDGAKLYYQLEGKYNFI